MAQNQKVLFAFISSPDDLSEEREYTDDVIEEFNKVWSKKLQKRLESIKWESDVYPGIAENSQSVINEQIGDNYDIFIGMMWTRFGSPTPRAESGTEEEFNNAIDKWQKSPHKIRILFYFKESPIDPTKIDPEQLILVNKFKDRIKKIGVLCGSFNTFEEFSQLIRMHLTMVVRDWGTKWGEMSEERPETKIETEEEKKGEEEYGLIDLLETGTENYNDLMTIMGEISGIVEDFGGKLTVRTEEIKGLKEQGDFGLKKMKRSINNTAADMDNFCEDMKERIGKFDEAHTKGINAFIKSANLLTDFKQEKDEAEKTLTQIRELEESFRGTNNEIEELSKIIAAWPRLTTHLNRSKRNILQVLEMFYDKISKSIHLIINLEKVLEGYSK